ncbi:hypothetical protein M0R45_013290 [Rubus argutus]|uniref:Uncharacterized protein n=1 Tax=Rubus argutus TaxID=59490 RepID=A0AAW1XIB1_RUBAR
MKKKKEYGFEPSSNSNDQSNLALSSSTPPIRNLSRSSSIFYAPNNASKPIRALRERTALRHVILLLDHSGKLRVRIRPVRRHALRDPSPQPQRPPLDHHPRLQRPRPPRRQGHRGIRRRLLHQAVHGGKIEDRESLDRIQKALLDAIDDCGGSGSRRDRPPTRGVVVRKPRLDLGLGLGERGAMAERIGKDPKRVYFSLLEFLMGR